MKLLSRKGNDLTADYPAIRRGGRRVESEVCRDRRRDRRLRRSRTPIVSASSPPFRQTRGDTVLRIRSAPSERKRSAGRAARRRAAPRWRKSSAVPTWCFQPSFPVRADDVIQAVAEVGLEGVVAKRRDSRYEAGKRSGVWQKFKVQLRQEFVIGGYKPENTNFQSIVVGYYENKKLRFAARVRAGFTARAARRAIRVAAPVESREVPVHRSAEHPDRPLGRRRDSRGHEDPQVGEAHACRRDCVYRVDARRQPASLGVRRTAK